jgi:hypothetical protein
MPVAFLVLFVEATRTRTTLPPIPHDGAGTPFVLEVGQPLIKKKPSNRARLLGF